MNQENQIVASRVGGSSGLLPAPRVGVAIRVGTMADVPFMDSLQKMHTKQVGWMPTKQFEGYVGMGKVLIAEELAAGSVQHAAIEEGVRLPAASCTLPAPLGYAIGTDRYFKRDDVGIIYQMNVVPGRQRGLVGATLLKAMFERSAWGCKLYCCWCAQDIAANKFWEAMGFVPLAFRTGGRGNVKAQAGARVHIFWQKRIRSGDTSTPWWFPSQTGGGAIREDRIVLPIPPGTHWSDAKPLVLPEAVASCQLLVASGEGTVASGQLSVASEERSASLLAIGNRQLATSQRPRQKKKIEPPKVNPAAISNGGLRFAPIVPVELAVQKPKPEKKPKAKNDPRLVAAARELKDRWLEEVNSGRYLPMECGKYDVSRAIEAGTMQVLPNTDGTSSAKLLEAA